MIIPSLQLRPVDEIFQILGLKISPWNNQDIFILVDNNQDIFILVFVMVRQVDYVG